MKIDIRFNDLAEVDGMENDLDILDSDFEYILSTRERITSSVSTHRKEVYRKEVINGSVPQVIDNEDTDSSEPKRPVGYSRAETSRSCKIKKNRRQEIRHIGMGLKDPETQITIPHITDNNGVNVDFDDYLSEAEDELPSDNDMGFDIPCEDRTSPGFKEAYLNSPRVRDKKPENTEVHLRKKDVFETPVNLRMGEYIPESHKRLVNKAVQSRQLLTSLINGTNFDLTRRLKDLRGKLGNPKYDGQKGNIELEIEKLENIRKLAYDAMKRTKKRVMKMKRGQKESVSKKNRRRYQIRQHEASFFSQAAANLKN